MTIINTETPQQRQGSFTVPPFPECLLCVPGYTGYKDKSLIFCSQGGHSLPGDKQAKKLFPHKECTLWMWVRTRWLLWQQRGDTTQLTSGTQGHSEGKPREADNVHHGTLLTSFPASSSTTWPSPTSYSRNALDIRFLKSPGFSTWISSCPECLPVSHHYKKNYYFILKMFIQVLSPLQSFLGQPQAQRRMLLLWFYDSFQNSHHHTVLSLFWRLVQHSENSPSL